MCTRSNDTVVDISGGISNLLILFQIMLFYIPEESEACWTACHKVRYDMYNLDDLGCEFREDLSRLLNRPFTDKECRLFATNEVYICVNYILAHEPDRWFWFDYQQCEFLVYEYTKDVVKEMIKFC
jgi:hypothetical protein